MKKRIYPVLFTETAVSDICVRADVGKFVLGSRIVGGQKKKGGG